MSLSTELSPGTFGLLFASTIVSTFLAGSTIQWCINKGLLEKTLFKKLNQYNVLVTIAATSSMVHTLLSFVNNLMAPSMEFGVAMVAVVNWTIMTQSSILLVSQRLSLTYMNPKLAWKRLLWINYILFPCCLAIGTVWAIAWNLDNSPVLDRIVVIVEPIQIALFGIIEFCLSGAFIVQMWKFQWTSVERHGIVMLILVGCCDVASVLVNLFLGDLESTCVKGLVYSLRIRLEVNVLYKMVDFIKNHRGTVSYGTSDVTKRPATAVWSLPSFMSGCGRIGPFRWTRTTPAPNKELHSHKAPSERFGKGAELSVTDQDHNTSTWKRGMPHSQQTSSTSLNHTTLEDDPEMGDTSVAGTTSPTMSA